MNRMDVHSAALIARQRQDELRREALAQRLIDVARTARRPKGEGHAATTSPLLGFWMELVPGSRPGGRATGALRHG
jgi:hypothetical protein